jgi:hypothetical protein
VDASKEQHLLEQEVSQTRQGQHASDPNYLNWRELVQKWQLGLRST